MSVSYNLTYLEVQHLITMSKLTQIQKQQLKDLFIDATVRRLMALEMQNEIQEKMQVTITIDYLRHIKSDISIDMAKQQPLPPLPLLATAKAI